jgi:L-seryl-tRNA(Ser) seleniumtransferase
VEVGSTNKTRLSDYADAITDDTQVLLKVHQSNFRLVGFTADVAISELAELAKERGLALVVDLGSGLLHREPGSDEPTIEESLAAGADIVKCSGDKLLGGPQAVLRCPAG